MTRKKEHIYHAAMLDPHTAAELSLDDIVSLCDELIEAHGDWLLSFNNNKLTLFAPICYYRQGHYLLFIFKKYKTLRKIWLEKH